MNARELDRIVASVNPVTDDNVERLDIATAQSELLEEIIATPRDAVADLSEGRAARRRRLSWRRGIGGASAVAAVTVLVLLLTIGGGARSEFADAAVAVAEANPRILLDAPGWSVVRADSDEFSVQRGEVTFSDGEHYLDVNWRPASEYENYMRDRAANGAAQAEVSVVGRRGVRFLSPGTSTFTTLLPPDGPVFVEITGQVVDDERAYMRLLRGLKTVDIDTWLAALPATTVRPADRAAVVDQMLEGIPLPDGFSVERLRGGNAVKDHYSLAMDVTGAVACTWLDRWNAARRAGDTQAERRAVDALRSSREWPVLVEMPQGGHGETVREYADQVAMRTPGYTGRQVEVLPGNDATIRHNYVSALGCG